MRHKVAGWKLGRNTSHRRSLLRNLVTSLIVEERIETTLPKAKALRPDVPVIMITAYGDAETKRKAFEGGAEALLTKPIDFVTLRNEIEAGSTSRMITDRRDDGAD